MTIHLKPLPRHATALHASEVQTVLSANIKVSIVQAGNNVGLNTICFRFKDTVLSAIGHNADDPDRCSFKLEGDVEKGIFLRLVGSGEGRRYNASGGLRFSGVLSSDLGFTNNYVEQQSIGARVERGLITFDRFPKPFFEKHNPSRGREQEARPHGFNLTGPDRVGRDMDQKRSVDEIVDPPVPAVRRRGSVAGVKRGPYKPRKSKKANGMFDATALRDALATINEQLAKAQAQGAEIDIDMEDGKVIAELHMKL